MLASLATVAATAMLIGHSVQGRPIDAVRQGDPAAPRKVLVIGAIHGNETAGHAVVGALRRMRPPAGLQVWTVRSVNPDGERLRTRQNAHGVDLNRNFPHDWAGGGRPGDVYYPGPRAGSEPETQAVERLVRRLHPDVTLWYHQHLDAVDLVPGVDDALIRDYARLTGLPARRLPSYHGTATSWENATVPGTTAFVVELPAGSLTPAAADRNARAVLAVARRAPVPASASGAAGPARAAQTAPRKPRIVRSSIPFPAKRRNEMRAYALRHYGIDSYRLEQPKVIVEHYTATATYPPVWNTFAADVPDPELHELPGTCAHFVIDRDGTIHQLVPLTLMCRHTVGLNYTAIGIEHVGTSDAQVMSDRRQLQASLRLTRWLQARFGIPKRNVIGHAESLSSPYHRERVAKLRTQTHGDMARRTMQRYRRML